jgi:hypothetical protein
MKVAARSLGSDRPAAGLVESDLAAASARPEEVEVREVREVRDRRGSGASRRRHPPRHRADVVLEGSLTARL